MPSRGTVSCLSAARTLILQHGGGSGLVETSLINREKMNKVIAAASPRRVEWRGAGGPGGRQAVSADLPPARPSIFLVCSDRSCSGACGSTWRWQQLAGRSTEIVTANQAPGNSNGLKKQPLKAESRHG